MKKHERNSGKRMQKKRRGEEEVRKKNTPKPQQSYTLMLQKDIVIAVLVLFSMCSVLILIIELKL